MLSNYQMHHIDKYLTKYWTDAKLSKEFTKSNPKKNDIIVDLVGKVSQHLYAQLCLDPRSRNISLAEVSDQVSTYFVLKAKKTRLVADDFDFHTANGLNTLKKNGVKLKSISEITVATREVTIDVNDASNFLESYKSQLKKYKQIEASIQRRLKSPKPNSDSRKLEEMQIKIANYTSAIDQIEAKSTNKITIIFPPKELLKDFTPEELKSILAIQEPSPAIREIKKVVKVTLAAKGIMERSAIKAAKSIQGSFDPMQLKVLEVYDKEVAAKVAQEIINNLSNRLEKSQLKVPLDIKTEKLITSYIDSFEFLKNTEKSNPYIKKLINEESHKIKLEYFKKLIKDNATIHNYELLHNDKSTSSTISKNLTSSQAKLVVLFDNIVEKRNPATYEELKYVAMMLEKSIGDMSLNRRLQSFEKEKGNKYANDYHYAANSLEYFCFKTQHISSYPKLLSKLEKGLQKIDRGEELSKEEQFSIFEYGRLGDLAKLKEKLNDYHQLGIIGKSKKLTNLYKQALKAEDLLQKVETRMIQEGAYKDGDILMAHSKKSLLLKNKHADLETSLTHTFISKYGHATQIYLDPETHSPKLSHIYGGYQSDAVKSLDIASADVFRVNVMKLVPYAMRSKLIKYYEEKGLNFEVELNKLYQQNIQKLHAESQKHFGDIHNSKSERFKA